MNCRFRRSLTLFSVFSHFALCFFFFFLSCCFSTREAPQKPKNQEKATPNNSSSPHLLTSNNKNRINININTKNNKLLRNDNNVLSTTGMSMCTVQDGATWLLSGPERSLAMILADTGLFDIWVSNLRGTKYSRGHSTLDPDDEDYWNWTWDDLVDHDVPAVIDFVFQTTAQKVHYIGHSMGTLIALAFLSEGKLVDRVKSATLLSPIAYLSHMTTDLGVMAARAFVGEIMRAVFDMAEFDPKSNAVSQFLNNLSGADCADLMSAFTGENCCLNVSTVNLFKKHEPQPTSTKNMVHLAQTVRYGVIAKYDYGNKAFNLYHYGTFHPPVYNLTNIPSDFPIFMSYGGRDALSDSRDVLTLQDNLKSHDVPKLQVQYIKDYAHADFIMGITAKDVLYTQIIKFLTSLR